MHLDLKVNLFGGWGRAAGQAKGWPGKQCSVPDATLSCDLGEHSIMKSMETWGIMCVQSIIQSRLCAILFTCCKSRKNSQRTLTGGIQKHCVQKLEKPKSFQWINNGRG